MKFDKETLVKHKFWVVYGIFLPLCLITFIWLESESADATEKKQKELNQLQQNLKDKVDSPAKTDNDIALMKSRYDDLVKRRQDVWEKAYRMQEPLQDWPPEVQEKLSKLK